MLPKLFHKTPLAWRQVMKEKGRLAVAVAGIAFADMLMFVQLAFQDALYDSTTMPHRVLEADLVMVNPKHQTLFSVKNFPRERLYQALGHKGVASVSSVYISMGRWKNPETRFERDLLVWGIEPDGSNFQIPEVKQHLNQIKELNTVLFDSGSRPEYGPIADLLQKHKTIEVEINKQNTQVVGVFALGSSFVVDGYAMTSDSTFMKLFPDRQPNQIEIGLIRLKPSFKAEEVREDLAKEITGDAQILTPEGMAAVERYYWESQGSIGFVFGLGVVVGFIVGIVIVYQILYSDVSDHLPEYATLKAMGYKDNYFLVVLLQEVLILAVLGYIPGYFISIGLYYLTHIATMLPIGMTLNRAITVFVLAVIMCSFSGVVALRKLRAADPADIF